MRARSLNRILNKQERIRFAKERLQREADAPVEVMIKYQGKTFKLVTTLAAIYWQIYKIHADAMIHLISEGFRKWLKETFEVRKVIGNKRGNDLIEEIYFAIWANCEVCRKYRKIVGYGEARKYGSILKSNPGKESYFLM